MTPTSALDATAAAFRAALLRRDEAALKRLMAAYQPASTRMQARVAALTAQIAKAEADGTPVRPSWLVERGRLETLQRQIVGEWARFADEAEAVITDAQRAAVTAAHTEAHQLTLAALHAGGVTTGADVVRLPVAAMHDLIGVLGDGSPLRSLLDRLGQQAAQDVGAALTHAVTVGRNPRQTARDIRDALGGDLTRALTIARTEQMRAYRSASLRNYQANSDILRGWRWLASPSRRTCPVCLAMDGTEHGLDEPFASHIRCRCTPVPVLRDAPAVDPDTTGAAWFARQPADVQRAMLGPGKHALYQQGKLTLADLVGVKEDARWGRSRYLKSLGGIQSGRETPTQRPTQAPPKPPEVSAAASARARLEHVAQRTKAKRAEFAQEIATLRQRRDELRALNVQASTPIKRQQARVELHRVRAKLDRLITQRDTLDVEYPELMRAQLYTRNPTQVRYTIADAVSDVQHPEIKDAVRAFEQMVEHSMVHLTVERSLRDYSYYLNGTNTAWMRDSAGTKTVIHEMGHWLEDVHPSVRDAARAFLDRRTAGETDVSLAFYDPRNYNPWEMTRPDQFRNPYVGKQYRDAVGNYTATEVLPMGLQWFYNEPLEFAREDPDMFDFIYAIVRKP